MTSMQKELMHEELNDCSRFLPAIHARDDDSVGK